MTTNLLDHIMIGIIYAIIGWLTWGSYASRNPFLVGVYIVFGLIMGGVWWLNRLPI